MTFIAKAMNKQTRYEAASERASREAGSDAPDDAPVKEKANAANDVPIFIPIRDDGSSRSSSNTSSKTSTRPSTPSAQVTARKLSPSRSKTRSKKEVPELEFIGTLESAPPELAPVKETPKRPWWREPMVIGGGALGLVALIMGFVVSPSGDSAGVDTAVVGPNEAALNTLLSSPDSSQVQSKGKPVVVRVEIDSGDGGSVEFESSGSSNASRAAKVMEAPEQAPEPVTPKIPEYYEPLQPLELPPPLPWSLPLTIPSPPFPTGSDTRRRRSPPAIRSVTIGWKGYSGANRIRGRSSTMRSSASDPVWTSFG